MHDARGGHDSTSRGGNAKEDAEEKDVSGAITRRTKSSVVWATAAVVCVEKALDVLVRPPEPHPELAWWCWCCCAWR